ncbi:Rad21/Rec8-like protein, N-terminal [Ostreococcus tauri]|uniref:Rad21/Rec8-like protein, N-terminal n=1 Tax=Ostreococcus tauri TaxID=70448 RepID=A0A090N3N2_OSTTA|nr:Rad21/Rec8-like protein, N-terminal [Ostreococcus tauri]CEF98413.1 Rad21/Rec8-like protein, N-terminal [Ostreococcus tauri]|eukprot:XP_022839247.1 Rad21/Rec8-like protein, N-terminal [Ostreococcus tauri]
MFYSQYILAKRGPLGTIWIAAHLDRKLRKNQIAETDIVSSVRSIINPEAPLALRLSGQLMLGVVRIYGRKVNYLFQDCSEALVKIKQVFRPGTVDLPADAAKAPDATITLPDNYDDLEFFFNPASVGATQGRASVSREHITLADDDDGFEGQFEYNEHLPEEDERLEDDVEVEVFRSQVMEAGVQLEDYDYVHDEYAAPPEEDEDNAAVDDDGFGDDDQEVMPLALDPDLMQEDDVFGPRQSIDGDSIFGGALPLPSIPGSSIAGDRPDDRVPGPASKRRKVERVVVFDRATALSNDQIRAQLRDTRDIVKDSMQLDVDDILSDPETLEASLRSRLMACDVGSKLNDAYRKASTICWGRPEGEARPAREGDDAETATPFAMKFNYADDDDGFSPDGGGFVGADDLNHEMPVDDDTEEQDGEVDWNVNSKLMLEHLTSAFASSGDLPLSLHDLTAGKKKREAARMFYQVLVLNAHEYLSVGQETAYGDVALSKGKAFSTAA